VPQGLIATGTFNTTNMLWGTTMSRMRSLGLLAAVVIVMTPAASFAQAWVNVAGAAWDNSDGQAMVAIGYSGTQPTADAAANAALQECQGAGGQGCQVPGSSVRGCAYITWGNYPGGVSWGAGGTPQDAIAEAQSAGATYWVTPIGGCGN
jgi:hypothetical protein